MKLAYATGVDGVPGVWSDESGGPMVCRISSEVFRESPDVAHGLSRLFAASPELLEACKAWVELSDSDGADGKDSMEWIGQVESQMRSAIAKAEGK